MNPGAGRGQGRIVRRLVLALVLAGVAGLQASPEPKPAPPGHPPAAAGSQAELIAVPPPPFSEGIYPCSDCHDGENVDTKRRKLEGYHEEIVFEHDAENRWCLDCHDAKNRDQLRRADGSPIPFTESWRLCGQCHGPTLRDWKAGDHGKRTGSWNGPKQYLLCVHCHNPHSPKFKPLPPKAPPQRPEDVR